MFDYHVHTSFSADSQEPIEAYLSILKDRGIEEFCVTEHMAVNFHRGDWMVNLDEYVPKIRKLQEEGWPVKLGIEADASCTEEDVDELTFQLGRYDLDFVLASSHSFLDLDPYMDTFFLGVDPIERCRDYLTNLLYCLKRIDPKLFSGLAHLDYLAKGFGAQYLPDGVFRYEYAPEEMDALMIYAIENGKCIEINTSSPQSLRGSNPPALSWLRRYHQLGGQFVTIGSDSHRTDRFGENIQLAEELAKEAGIKYIATYRAMEPILHKI